MNIATRPIPFSHDRPDGVTRRKWTGDEVLAMAKAGIIGPGERYQLIGGDLVTMASKGARHEIVRCKLLFHWVRSAPDGIMVTSESPLKLNPNDEPEPDLMLFPATIPVPDVRGDTALLVVEVADWSLSYDLKVKSLLYAAHGVREYWMIDADKTLVTHVHRRPSADGYASVVEVPPSALLTPQLVPALAVRLADLSLA